MDVTKQGFGIKISNESAIKGICLVSFGGRSGSNFMPMQRKV